MSSTAVRCYEKTITNETLQGSIVASPRCAVTRKRGRERSQRRDGFFLARLVFFSDETGKEKAKRRPNVKEMFPKRMRTVRFREKRRTDIFVTRKRDLKNSIESRALRVLHRFVLTVSC